MDWSSTDVSTTLDFNSEGKQIGDLRLSYSNNEQPLGYHPIPVVVIKNGTGPTLLLTGGTHGDEYEGPVILLQLIHSFDYKDLNGRIIIIPALNTPAVLEQSRCSPLDNGNLNRAFPGNRHSNPTSMIAHFIEDIVLPECDAAIDFHSGGNASVFIPLTIVYLGANTVDYKSIQLAEAFGAPYLWSGKFRDDSFNAAAIRKDIPMFATELGGGGGVDPDMIQLASSGLLRVMTSLKMLTSFHEEAIGGKSITNIKVCENGKIYANREGIFVPTVKPGQSVKSGDMVGIIYSIIELDREPAIFHVSDDGIILSVVNRGLVRRGELLALIGRKTNCAM